MKLIEKILNKNDFTRENLVTLLSADKEDSRLIYAKAAEVKKEYVGNKVYLRGLVELSNICSKNCYYCGIRSGNKNLKRYELDENEVKEAVDFAYKNNYASMVIQSGERKDRKFVNTISYILDKINEQRLTNNEQRALAITLSLGEQSEETYRKWFEKGAKRYLLRIETSSREHYLKLHPNNKKHDFDERMNCIRSLKKIGYQVGTGVMIGLPFQTTENLADDLLFFRDIDIDMCGMGPYIEHKDTPLYEFRDKLLSKKKRFELSLKMVALLRIMMKDINIAATTAMQTLDPQGREKAIKVGANVIMPNLTPVKYRENYLLYENKPCIDEEAKDCMNCLEARVYMAGDKIAFGEVGTSKHYANRKSKV
jgi:biotin synthase